VLLQFHELLLSITAFPCSWDASLFICFTYVLAFVQARWKYIEWTLDRIVAWTNEGHGIAVNVKFFVYMCLRKLNYFTDWFRFDCFESLFYHDNDFLRQFLFLLLFVPVFTVQTSIQSRWCISCVRILKLCIILALFLLITCYNALECLSRFP